jgi:hypothetical protein
MESEQLFDDTQKTAYIDLHLGDELHFLLHAAAEWNAWEHLSPFNRPIKVYAMDSVYVHARALYEFFTMSINAISNNEEAGKKPATWASFGLVGPFKKSGVYKKQYDNLHRFVLHLRRDRSDPKNTTNRQVMPITFDILEYWQRFPNHPAMDAHRGELITVINQEIENVSTQYKGQFVTNPFLFFKVNND